MVSVQAEDGWAVTTRFPSNLQWNIKCRLSGVQAVTISAPGVLLEENSPKELEVGLSCLRSNGLLSVYD